MSGARGVCHIGPSLVTPTSCPSPPGRVVITRSGVCAELASNRAPAVVAELTSLDDDLPPTSETTPSFDVDLCGGAGRSPRPPPPSVGVCHLTRHTAGKCQFAYSTDISGS